MNIKLLSSYFRKRWLPSRVRTAGTAFIFRVQASDLGPKCVSFKSVEELESKLARVGLPKEIPHGEIGLQHVTDDQLKGLGFTEFPT